MMGYRYQKPKVKVVFDIYSVMLIVISLVLFAYMGTYIDQNIALAVKGIMGAIFLIGGLLMISFEAFGVGYIIDPHISPEEIVEMSGLIAVAFVAILVVNKTIWDIPGLSALSSVPINLGVFGMIMGVAEEIFNRGFLLNLFSNVTDTLTALVVATGIGTIFHGAVYGQRDIQVLIIVFGSFLVLGIVWILSGRQYKDKGRIVIGRRLSIVMIAHALVNLMAVIR